MKINAIFLVIFFIAGALFAYFMASGPVSVRDIKEVKQDNPPLVWTAVGENSEKEFAESALSSPLLSAGKFTIAAEKQLSADRKIAQTGETVKFSVGLKNTGANKKFLTHICFNDSAEGNFGCIRNKNLEPGQSFSFDGFMTYKQPGRHTVSVSWSQDHNNFYHPSGHSPVTVEIY